MSRKLAFWVLAAERLVLALLQDAQELDLHRGAELADLVEEERAAGGLGDAALALLDGAGEGALLVTEELGLDDGLGQRREVHADEGPVAPAALVDEARDQLLAGAALAEHQHVGGGGRGLPRGVEGVAEGRGSCRRWSGS